MTLSVVEVEHPVLVEGRSIRLEIDGIDVTSYANFGRGNSPVGPGRLVYDAELANNVVPLRAGEHTATVKLVEFTEAAEEPDVVDAFTWQFTIT